jgi:CHAT domain-containing protein
MSRSDKIIAAEVIMKNHDLWFDDQLCYQNENYIVISEYVSNQLSFIINNSSLRFLALNIHNIQSLINVYLDFCFEHIPINQHDLDILISFQNCFYSKCLRFIDLRSDPKYAKLFIEELSQLLRHSQEETLHITGEHFQNNTEDMITSSAANLSQLAVATLAKENKEPFTLSNALLEAKKHVSESEALFLYYCTDNSIYLVLILHDRTNYIKLRLSRSECFERIINMKSDLLTLYLFEADDFGWIYETFLRPGIELINSAPIYSIVIIDAELSLPFHLAYNRRRRQFLIEEYAVSYCHSVTAFCQSRRASNNRIDMPEILLSGFAGTGQKLLPLVNRELSAIKDFAAPHGYRTSFLADTFLDVERIAGDYNVFHFSGHVTGNSNTERAWTLHYRDGPVEASRLLKVLHPGVFLCSLLGCSSAEHIGSSLIGANGLLSAVVAWGVPNVIGFLWPVPDDIAAGISIRFYDKWLNQEGSVRECLRLSLLEQDRVWGPAVWGSAVCFGA